VRKSRWLIADAFDQSCARRRDIARKTSTTKIILCDACGFGEIDIFKRKTCFCCAKCRFMTSKLVKNVNCNIVLRCIFIVKNDSTLMVYVVMIIIIKVNATGCHTVWCAALSHLCYVGVGTTWI